MKSTELRLLNLVEYLNWNDNKTPAYFMVRDIFWEDGKIAVSNGIIHLPHPSMDMIKPIPLTEEWLEKFGCVHTPISKSRENYWNKEMDFSVDVEQTFMNNEKLFYYLICNQDRRKSIQYVHQLQNLYFSLTGEELTIKN